MNVFIKKESPETKKFLKYIFSKIVRHSPLSFGELVEVNISEKSTPFPMFTEYWREKPVITIEGVKLTDEKERRRKKIVAISNYVYDELCGLCEVVNDDSSNKGPIDINFAFKIIIPEQLEARVKELGIATGYGTQKKLEIGKEAFTPSNQRPVLTSKDGRGFLTMNDEKGKKIKIGRTDSRSFKLLQTLSEPSWGTAKTIDAVFEAIRIPKDASNTALNDSYRYHTAKEEKTIDTRRKIGSILKREGLQGALQIHIKNKKCWAEWK